MTEELDITQLQKWDCIIEPTRIGKKSYGGLYLADIDCAQDSYLLQKLQIGAILSVIDEPEIHLPKELKYIIREIIDIPDCPQTNILDYIPRCSEFIERHRNHTNVMVHCFAGISRSATAIIAYMMEKFDWDFQKTLQTVKTIRKQVKPNEGFRQQLMTYEKQLQTKQIRNSIQPKYQARSNSTQIYNQAAQRMSYQGGVDSIQKDKSVQQQQYPKQQYMPTQQQQQPQSQIAYSIQNERSKNRQQQFWLDAGNGDKSNVSFSNQKVQRIQVQPPKCDCQVSQAGNLMNQLILNSKKPYQQQQQYTQYSQVNPVSQVSQQQANTVDLKQLESEIMQRQKSLLELQQKYQRLSKLNKQIGFARNEWETITSQQQY